MSIKKNKPDIIIFKSSDYDLDEEERKAKYKDNLVLCEKCNQKINRYWRCKKCYDNETEEEKHRMLYGRCKGCSQVMKIPYWCSSCNSKRFQQDFNNWTSGNEEVNKLIRDIQTSACNKYVLEWITYDRFTDIEFIAKGGFAEIYSATWIDGRIEKWDQGSTKWKRSGPFKVALKILENSKDDLSKDFLNELKFLKNFPSSNYTRVLECYGITREPNTRSYALVLKLKDCSLRFYLDNYYNTLTLKDKLDIIGHICLGLNCLHSHNIIHRDFHPGNILHSLGKKSDILISDFGCCKPAHEASEEKKIYGVMPYMAPETLRYRKYQKESDIYSFGIIVNEIISGSEPFHDRPHDYNLAVDICSGRHPNIRPETPEPLKKLIKECLDKTPENRPDTNQIYTMLQDFIYAKNEDGSYDFKKHTEQYEKLKESSYEVIPKLTLETSKTREEIPQAKHNSKLLNLLNLPNPVNSKSTCITVDSDISLKTEHSNCSDCKIDVLSFKSDEYSNHSNRSENILQANTDI